MPPVPVIIERNCPPGPLATPLRIEAGVWPVPCHHRTPGPVPVAFSALKTLTERHESSASGQKLLTPEVERSGHGAVGVGAAVGGGRAEVNAYSYLFQARSRYG